MGFCTNCGAQVPDGAVVCPTCGATTGAQGTNAAQQMQYNQANYGQPMAAQVKETGNPIVDAWKNAEAKMGSTKLFGICVGVIVLILLLFVGGCANSYKSPVKKYYGAMKKGNPEKMYKCCDDELLDEMDIDEEYFEEIVDDMEEYDEELLKYKIVAVKKYTKDEIEDFSDRLDDAAGYDKKISKLYGCYVRCEYDYDGEIKHRDRSVIAYKAGLKWYIIPTDLY